MEKVKIVNLFRLARRLELSQKPELFQVFERSLYDSWENLSISQKNSLEQIHLRLKEKYHSPTDKEKLFGVKSNKSHPSDFDLISTKELEKQILDLAKNMKQVATNFSTSMQQDNFLLDSIATKQSKYLIELEKEQRKIEKINVKTSWFASLRTLFAVIFSLVLFVVMLGIIHLFPSTTYISLNKS